MFDCVHILIRGLHGVHMLYGFPGIVQYSVSVLRCVHGVLEIVIMSIWDWLWSLFVMLKSIALVALVLQHA